MAARLQLLGAPAWTLAGKTTLLPITKPCSLLLYLACRGDWVSRNELAFLYRPDEPDVEALKYLRKLIFRARQFSWAEGFEAQDTRLRWLVASDVQVFSRAFEDKRWSDALDAYQGPLLQSFSLPDAPGFEAWLELERDNLASKWKIAASHCAEALQQQGKLAEAGVWLARLLEHDPLDEDTLQTYLQILQASGERRRAREAYAAFCKTLKRELDAEPLETTQALADSIQRESNEVVSVTAPVPSEQRHNLPAHTTRFIGRTRELELLARYLAKPERRLVTLLGLGGTGKTRLALESASQHVTNFTDGVWFVPLAGVSASSLLAPSIANTLGLNLTGSEPHDAQLADYLRNKHLLLLLDNLEHLTAGALLLETLLEAAPNLKLLITSQVALELPGEWLFDLEGLDYPPADHEDELEGFDAVKLFINRAERLSSNFVATGTTLGAIARLCRQVEGMPLALELAATWTRSLGVSELVKRLEHNFTLLVTQAKDRPERHRNLVGVLDYTWGNLGPDEQGVLAKLSLFRGGFTLEAAEAVADAHLGLLLRFINHALVRRNPSGRFDLHELVRHYLAERLEASAKTQAVGAFYHFFAGVLTQRERALKEGAEKTVLRELDSDTENLRLAWQWAAEKNAPASLHQMAECLYFLLDTKGWYREGADLFETAVERLAAVANPPATQDTVAPLLSYQGYFEFRLGQLEKAKHTLERSLNALGSRPAAKGFVHHYLGVLAFLAGDNEGAQERYHQALACYQQVHDRWSMAKTHNNLGVVADTLGAYEDAMHWYRLSLDASREAGHVRGVASALVNLGVTFENLGQLDEAAKHYQESLEAYREVHDVRGEAASLTNLGHLAERNQAFAEAKAYYQQSVILKRKLGDPVITAISLTNLGDVQLTLGDTQQALAAFREALDLTHQAQALPYALRVIWSYAKLYAKECNWPCALYLANFLVGAPESEVWVRDEAEQALGRWGAEVSQAKRTAAAVRAKQLSFKELIESVTPNA